MSEETLRPDGRGQKELRPLTIEVGVLERADGSSKVILGKNIAIASVYGPREMHPKHAALPDKAVVRMNYRMSTFSVDDYKKSYPSRREKEISMVLSSAYESIILTKNWPRSVIDVHIQILQSDGGTRTVASIAAAAALADAGIPMRDLAAGIASGIYEDKVVLDLCGEEDMHGTGDMPILYSPANDEVILLQIDGSFTFEQFKDAFNTSRNAIKDIVLKIREALKEKYLKVRDDLGEDEEHDEAVDTTILDDEAVAEQVDVGAEDEESSGLVLTPMTEEDKLEANHSQPDSLEQEQSATENTVEASTTQNKVTNTDKEETKPEEIKEEKPQSSIASTVASLGKEVMDAPVAHNWYTKTGAELRPMGTATEGKRTPMREHEDEEDEDTTNIMRDIEYLEDDE